MNNILIVLRREYLNKVKKKSFIILTILVPILFAGLMFIPAILAASDIGKEEKIVAVVDETSFYTNSFENSKDKYIFYTDVIEAKDSLKSGGVEAVLYIYDSIIEGNKQNSELYYNKTSPSLDLISDMERLMRTSLKARLMSDIGGIDNEIFDKINKASVNVASLDVDTGVESYTGVKTTISFVLGFLIYGFVFFFGAQIMTGVLEEKTNRIIEIIISSIKPFELLMGKVLGLALVGLTQFFIWGVFTTILVVAGSMIMGFSLNPEELVQVQEGMMAAGTMGMDNTQMTEMAMEIQNIIGSIDFTGLFVCFILYFFGGYFLYASLFAAVGSAVDKEEDATQFTLPISLPLILAIIVSSVIIKEPNGTLAFWASMIPFTSPICMLMRIPFGVDTWEIVLSLVILAGSFVLTTYLAAKIYRVGILMYGKKASYKELWKWITYKN